MQDNEIIINCKNPEEAAHCAEILDSILNQGPAAVSVDYLDFLNDSDNANYNFEIISDLEINNCNECINTLNLSVNCKHIIYLIGNITFADATNIMQVIADVSHKDTSIVFGLSYNDEQSEGKFNLHIWNEII